MNQKVKDNKDKKNNSNNSLVFGRWPQTKTKLHQPDGSILNWGHVASLTIKEKVQVTNISDIWIDTTAGCPNLI